jgi:acetyl-CoA/propionyl-CoA carboxylase carboxyl transferase subunit
VRILHRRKLAKSPMTYAPKWRPSSLRNMSASQVGWKKAVEIGVVDEIVAPDATRSALAAAIRSADTGERGAAHQHSPLLVTNSARIACR